MDEIFIKNLRIDCIVGILPEERKYEQPLFIDVALGLDFSDVVKTGDLGQSVDYDHLTNQIIDFIQAKKYLLLETAAVEISDFLFSEHAVIEEAEIKIKKPRALAGRAEYASVRIKRSRKDAA